MANEYEKALAHAKAGRLETAQQILIGLEDERSEKLLAKVNKAIAARNAGQVSSATVAQGIKQADKAKQQEKAKQQGYGCLVLIAIMVVCFVIFTATNQPSIDKTRAQICVDALQGMPMGTTCILSEFPEAMELCYNRLGDLSESNRNTWFDCLYEQGVGSNMLFFPN